MRGATHRDFHGCLSSACAPSRATSSGRCGTPATPPRAGASPLCSRSSHPSGPLCGGRGTRETGGGRHPIGGAEEEDERTCCEHQGWPDHVDGVGAEFFKVGRASRVVKSADVDVRHLEADTGMRKKIKTALGA